MHVTYEDLTKMTGKSYRTIRQKISGLEPISKKGKRLYFDSSIALPLLYSSSKPHSEKLDLQQEKALESRERRRKLERENKIQDRRVIGFDEIVDLLQDVSKQCVAVLESLPLNIKRRVPQLKAKDIEFIKLEIAKARNAIASIEVKQ